MDLSELEYDDIRKIEKMKENDSEVVYNDRKNILYKALISDEYLVIDDTKEVKEWFNYKFYKPTEKFINASIDKVLMDLVGYDKVTILKKKVISINDVPYDFEDVFKVLVDSNGYFNHIDIGDGVFRRALDMHGFTIGSGTNGHYSSGTKKLAMYTNSNRDYEVIEILTGKTKEENNKIIEEASKEKEFNTKHETARKYGYIVSRDCCKKLV